MGNPSSQQLTALLLAWRVGDKNSFDRLFELVHKELRRLAQWQMDAERRGHTLQATALVHEAYLRLIKIQRVDWQDRAHFFAVVARVMRRILVDKARERHYQKRGGGDQTSLSTMWSLFPLRLAASWSLWTTP